MMSTRIYSKMNLYRSVATLPPTSQTFAATVALIVACCVLTLSGTTFQRHSHKLRATALLELTTDASGKVTTRLIPITILANGSFHDAGIYESRPRPMALGTGVVYEAQKTGNPVGYITLNSASDTLEGWVGEGRWQSMQEKQAHAAPKPAPPRPTPGDDRPILHRGSGDQSQPAGSTQPQDDRPVLHRGDSDSQSPPSSAPQPSSSADTASAPDDPNRPVLRRRKPAGAENTDDNEVAPPPASKPPATPPPQSVQTRPLPVPNVGVQTFVAVSDAEAGDTRSYEFQWRPDEKPQIEGKMRKLALAQLPGEGAQLNEHALTNVVVRSFDQDLSNDAVVVITAEVPGAYLAPGTKTGRGAAAKSAPEKFVSRYITVIARVDIDGNPQKLSAGVTDSSRLDVFPRLELIDAVDVDGDGLAELLFREYGFDQKSFLIYGVGHGTVTKVFEGASTPLN